MRVGQARLEGRGVDREGSAPLVDAEADDAEAEGLDVSRLCVAPKGAAVPNRNLVTT